MKMQLVLQILWCLKLETSYAIWIFFILIECLVSIVLNLPEMGKIAGSGSLEKSSPNDSTMLTIKWDPLASTEHGISVKFM